MWASLMPIKPPKGSHLPCQMNTVLTVWLSESSKQVVTVFFTKPHKSNFQMSAKTLSLPGYPCSPFLGATLRDFQEKQHELMKGRLVMIACLVKLLLNYHQRDSGNRGKFWSITDTSARSASQRSASQRSAYAETKVSNLGLILQSRSSTPKSHGWGGDRELMLPQEGQMPAARHFSGCLQTGCPCRTFQEIPYIDLPAWPQPWAGMGGTVLAQASWRIPGQVFLPRMPWHSPNIHLTLVSKSLDTQPVWFCWKAQHWYPKYNADATMLKKGVPNSNLLLQDLKIMLLYRHDHSHVTEALFTKFSDILL